LAISLLVINPAVALAAIVFFGVITWGVQRALGGRAARFGSQSARVDDLLSLRTIQEALGAYREITVTGRRSFYIEHLRNLRDQSARSAVTSQMVALLPKYVSEAGLVLGAFMLAVVLFTTQPVAVAAGTLTAFLAAATRVVPALLRMQSAALSIRAASGPAEPTFALAEDLGHPLDTSAVEAAPTWLSRDGYPDFVPSVDVRDVTYAFAGAGVPALRDVNLTISAGQTVALVGRSGAGKSTLADVILGVLQPDAGEVLLGGIQPSDAIRRWPGAVAYVPQQIMLVEASVRANVALGLPEPLIDDEQVWAAIGHTQLADFVRTKSDGLDTQIGERGLRLSGGQRQRLGIARALYSQPRLLILDEATSALDAETEQAITSILNDLGQSVTVVVIAHRLSTVRHADLVVYLEDGSVVAAGSFAEVCARVPAFRRQAELMGLRPA
jgi:ABC-type multidrug transport system fused ATPase/permease subunit